MSDILFTFPKPLDVWSCIGATWDVNFLSYQAENVDFFLGCVGLYLQSLKHRTKFLFSGECFSWMLMLEVDFGYPNSIKKAFRRQASCIFFTSVEFYVSLQFNARNASCVFSQTRVDVSLKNKIEFLIKWRTFSD